MKAILKHQNFLKGCVILAFGCVSSVGVWWMLSDEPVSHPKEDVASKIEPSLPASPQEIFHHKIEMQNDLLKKQLEAQGKILEELMRKQEAATTRTMDDDLVARIKDLEAKLSQKAEHSAESLPSVNNTSGLNLFESNEPSKQGIQRVKVNLSPQKGLKTGHTVDTTLPAGSFVKALILGGVAASTSITAAQNPKPVLLNLVEQGSLPRGFFSDLKDCRLTAASYGDLSSERVSMRLEKLSCVERATGEIIETPVSGYVVGEDGFEGVKGAISDRTGPMMRNSFVAGFFGGLSSAMGQAAVNNPLLSTPLGIQQNVPKAQQLLQQGAGKGVQGAMEKYAEFYIKRAEQMQPVLYVRAGRHVDVVFTEGVSFGDTLMRKAIHKSKEGARLMEARKVAQAATPAASSHTSQGEESSW